MASLQQQQQDNKDQQQNNNNNNNNKKVTIHAREDSASELENLFDLSLNKGGQRSLYVPLRMRNLPASFWQPPTLGSKSPSVHSRENSLDNSLGTFSPVPPGSSPGGGVGTAHHNRANSCPATLEQTLAVAQQQVQHFFFSKYVIYRIIDPIIWYIFEPYLDNFSSRITPPQTHKFMACNN